MAEILNQCGGGCQAGISAARSARVMLFAMAPFLSSSDGTLGSRYRRIGIGFGNARFDPSARLITADPGAAGRKGEYLIKESVQYARILMDGHKDQDLTAAHDILEAVRQAGGFAAAGDADSGCEAARAMLDMLYRHSSRIGAETRTFLEDEIKKCCASEIDRWVSPLRTASGLLAGSCLVCGGEWLRDPETARRGAEKLEEVAAHGRATGGRGEFNSPSRSGIMLHALAAVLAYARDPEAVRVARELWEGVWLSLLEHAHSATANIAGPHSRAAGRDMRRDTRGTVKYYLHRALGAGFPLGTEASGGREDLFAALIADDPDCPEALKHLGDRLKVPRSVTEISDSYSGYREIEKGSIHPEDRERGDPGLWAESVEHRGRPGRPGFHGSVKRITSYLSGNYCIGSVNCEPLNPESAPILAHWTSGRQDRANYLAVLAVLEREGAPEFLPGAVMCAAQQEGRVLGLLRFETDPAGKAARAGRAALAFQINKDCNPEIMTLGEREAGPFRLDRGVIVRAEGILIGIRALRVKLPGAAISAEISEKPAPGAHPEGELGMHIALEPFSPLPGEPAYAAFALEIGDEEAGEGISGMTRRLRAARVADELPAEGMIRLAWGATLVLESSTRVLGPNGWMSREGSVG